MTQNNEKVTQKCKGTNCGTTNNNHSKECLAEHEAAYKSNEYDTAGNRHPEFRYKGYKGEPLPNNHTIDQFNAYAEGIKARVTPISQNEQQEVLTTRFLHSKEIASDEPSVDRRTTYFFRVGWNHCVNTMRELSASPTAPIESDK